MSPDTDPIEINVLSSPDQAQCNAPSPPSSDSNFDPAGSNSRTCKTQQMIWARECGNVDLNRLVENMLTGMDAHYLTSTDPFCKVKGGVLFWLAMLTPQETEILNGENLAVSAVFPNVPYKFGESVKETKVPTGRWRRRVLPNRRKKTKKKRARLSVVKNRVNDLSLSFLSTPPGKTISGIYSYFRGAGREITVFVVDTGFDGALRSDFLGLSYIYALNAEQSESDSSEDQSGTIVAQKIGSAQYGVSPETTLVIIKTAEDLASFIDALAKIIANLRTEREESGMELKGRKVVTIRGGLDHVVYPGGPLDQFSVPWMHLAMEWLSQDAGVPIVLSASLARTSGYPYLFSLDNPHGQRLDIITVGRVLASWDPTENGSPIRSAPQSAQVKIYAPGNGLARIPGSPVPANVEGDFISVGIAAGMVSYVLSLPDLGASLIIQANLAAALIWFLQNRLSVTRFVATGGGSGYQIKSLWNGLDASDDEVKSYENWYGPTDTRPDGL